MFPVSTVTARNTLAYSVAALTLAAGLLAAPAAEAKNGRNAALFGGLAAGTLLGGLLAQGAPPPAYAGVYPAAPAYAPALYPAPAYGDVYVAPRPWRERAYYPATAYVEDPDYVAPCWRERQPLFDAWGRPAGFRTVRVCR